MFQLNDKVAVVTGGSRGIGRAIAECLAGRGAHVVVNYMRSEGEAQKTVDGIVAKGGHAEALRFDVRDAQATEAAFADVAKKHGRLDILVSNAGVVRDALLLRAKDDEIDLMLSTNLKGALHSARAALKTMIRSRVGRIVFVSSVAGEMGNAGQAAYAASKAGVLGLMRSLAREVASRNITVNAVAPGLIDTDMTAQLTSPQKEKTLQAVPLGRTGRTEEVAAAVAFLCSDDASYITGQTLGVNGGLHI